MGVSEPGMADRQYTRYLVSVYTEWARVPELLVKVDMMWIEWKRLDRFSKKENCWLPTKASQKQHDWHARERARGALTLIAGEDFPASIEGFCTWYAQSGLQRKRISIPR
jgi:hypothetical protein